MPNPSTHTLAAFLVITSAASARAEQPPPPCHPNPEAASDAAAVAARGDVASLPAALRDQLVRLADRPHSVLPVLARAEADSPSQLFLYYLLDTKNFEANPFVAVIPGINDGNVQKTSTGGNCGLPAVGAVRLVVEPKPGLPTDPANVRTFIDVFTDISGLFVINNESGWYEGWMIHDLTVADVAPPRRDGHAQFGNLTVEDAEELAKRGAGHNRTGRIFTMDGNEVRFPSEADRFPDKQTNVVPIQLSMGAYNALQQADAHSYWEFNYTTNWIHPLYELPFTGGFPDSISGAADAFQEGEIGRLLSIIPGSGPSGVTLPASVVGDSPFRPRDPDLFDADVEAQREFRQRFIPSGLANTTAGSALRSAHLHPE